MKRRGDINLPIYTRIPKVITLELAPLPRKEVPLTSLAKVMSVPEGEFIDPSD